MHALTGRSRFEPGSIRCREFVEVVLPCGHPITVPCHEAEQARGKRELCRQEVEVDMPWCGHTIKVSSGSQSVVCGVDVWADLRMQASTPG